jgi:hypothetical protein
MLALAGAFVGPFLQRKHDRWLARRADQQILRQKAEELFAELDTLALHSGQASVRTFERLQNKELDAIALPDLGRVRAIATIYFPKLLPHFDRFQDEQKSFTEKIIPDLGRAGEASDYAKIKGITAMLMLNHQEIVTKLVQDIRREMVEMTPKYEDIS